MNRKMRAKANNEAARKERSRRSDRPKCPDCGEELKPIGVALVVVDSPPEKRSLH